MRKMAPNDFVMTFGIPTLQNMISIGLVGEIQFASHKMQSLRVNGVSPSLYVIKVEKPKDDNDEDQIDYGKWIHLVITSNDRRLKVRYI